MDEAIDRALLAHGEWKKRLASTIEMGDKTLSPDVVAKDDQCEFGKWLYLEVPADGRAQPICERARKLHADFHKEASRVLVLAQGGQRWVAMEAIQTTSEFTRLSGALALVLSQWKFKLAKANSGSAGG